MTESGRVFLITFGGFHPAEKVQVTNRLGYQRVVKTIDASSGGTVRFPVMFDRGDSGVATAEAASGGGSVSIEYAIGSEAVVRQ